MAESGRSHSLRRLAAATVLGAALVAGGLPLPGGATLPDTVLRSVPIPARALVAEGPGLTLARDGTLRAATSLRSARTRVCAPIWFTAVAVTWAQGSGDAAVARLGVGRQELVLEAEGGPDPGTPDAPGARQGTNLLWTGGGRCVRLSLDLPAGAAVADVQVVFVNSSGTADGSETPVPNTAPVVMGGAALPVAGAMTRTPRLVTREQWGANPSLMNCTPDVADGLQMGFVHHTAGSNRYRREESDDVVRAIYAYHTNGRGWCDIAYNFLVDRFGTAFEGRSGGPTLPVVGAATQGFNTESFSVAVMGNFDTVRPPRAALRGLRRVLAWRLDVAHLPPRGRALMVSFGGDNTRYPKGTEVELPVIAGHRTTGYTACPGGRLYSKLRDIRRRVAAMGLPKMYRPRLSRSDLPPEVDRLRVRAKGSEPLKWTVVLRDAEGSPLATLPSREGERLDLLWLDADGPALPREPGTYALRIRGRAADGQVARAAVLGLTVPPIPSPSPTPSPSATASP